jgi:two-component system sensor histidine kinase/response regulator
MDGYDATTAIRMMEEAGITGSRVPIVAMTAHAMKGDREKCLAAGMDDYLTKPLQSKELLDTVRKWTATFPQYHMDQEEEESAEIAMVEEKIMNLEKAVEEFGGDREFLVKILNGFLSNVKQQFETIEQAIGNNNAEVVRREAHSIKGGAANLTAEGLRSIAFELENIGSSGNLGGASEILSRLVREFDRLHEFTRNIKEEITGEVCQEKRGVR